MERIFPGAANTIIWELGQGYLKEAVAFRAGALLSSMAVLVHNTISKVVVLFTVVILHKITIGVGLLQRGGLQLDVGLEVGVLEGGGEGAAVGSPGRQLAAIGGDRGHRDSEPRQRDGVTWAGGVLGPRREAWRLAVSVAVTEESGEERAVAECEDTRQLALTEPGWELLWRG